MVQPPRVRIGDRTYPATLSTAEAADWLDCGVNRLRDEAGHGVVQPLKLGHRLRWPTLQVAEVLGLPAEVVHDDPDDGSPLDAGTLPEPEPALVGAAAPGSEPGAPAAGAGGG